MKVLNPIDVATEVAAGVVTALSVSLSLYTVHKSIQPTALVGAVLGCNLAWGLFDSLTFVGTRRDDRARKQKVLVGLKQAPDVDALRTRLRDELGDALDSIEPFVDLEKLRAWLARAPTNEPKRSGDWSDIAAGGLVGLVQFASALPIVVPLMLMANASAALRTSSIVGLVMMTISGVGIARWNGQSVWLHGVIVPLVGAAFVVTCLAFGG